MQDSRLTTFVAADGDNLAIQDWPLDPEVPLRGVVMLVHGLGEHAGRYDELARRLNAWRFAVRGYDQYGHGESGGVRGGLPTENRLLDDLADVLSSTRARMPRHIPLILLGHSMGGVVAARYVVHGLVPVDGLVLSSPAFDLGLGMFQSFLAATLPELTPNLRVHNGVHPERLSHDPTVIRDYQQDRLIHHRVSARLVRFMADAGRAVIKAAPQWDVPTLLMYGASDQVINPQGSVDFAKAAPPNVVTTCRFENLYHEIFNELDREQVYEKLKQWLDRWFP